MGKSQPWWCFIACFHQITNTMSRLTWPIPLKLFSKSPVGHIHKSWLDSKLYKVTKFDEKSGIKLLLEFLEQLSQQSHCCDMNKPFIKATCSCMTNYTSIGDKEKRCHTCWSLPRKNNLNNKHYYSNGWRYAQASRSAIATREGRGQRLLHCYFLPGTSSYLIYQHGALAVVLGVGKNRWRTVKTWIDPGVRPVPGLTGHESNRCKDFVLKLILYAFLLEMLQFASPRATLVVHNLAGETVEQTTRSNGTELVELSSSFTKGSLYNCLLSECGWKVKFNNLGTIIYCRNYK